MSSQSYHQPPAYSILSSPPDTSLTPEQQNLKERFDAQLGPEGFDQAWSRMLKNAPEMFAASLRLTSVPKRKCHLLPRLQSMVSLAISAALTHLHVPSVHRYTRAALKHGATKAEIIEVLMLTSSLGIHACTAGVPLLIEVLKEQGKTIPKGMEGMTKEQWTMKEDFEQKRGHWNGVWEHILRLSPEFFDAFTEFSSLPWANERGQGNLEPKVKELILCALKSTAAPVHQTELKSHMRNVLKHGGTADEIMETMELASLLSISTMDVGLEVLEEELAKPLD